MGLASVWVIAQQPEFRANVEAIVVEVSVRRGAEPAVGLTAGDFWVEDDGVRQRIEDVTLEQMPLEFVIALDTSLSTNRASVAASKSIDKASLDALQLLRQGDRLKTFRFGGKLGPYSAETLDPGRTSVYDALAEILLDRPSSEHRRAVVVVSDAFDTNSLLSAALTTQIADRADATVFVIAVRAWNEPDFVAPFGGNHNALPPNYSELQNLANRTGGAFEAVRPDEDLLGQFRQRVADLRSRYILRYFPSGHRQGWHRLSAGVRAGRYSIRHKSGYWR